MKTPWQWMILGAGALAGIGLLCGAVDQPPAFSHRFHLEEAGAECASCHVEQAGARLPVLSQAHCSECHDPSPAWSLPARARRLAVAFPHVTHSAIDKCARCHPGIAEDAIDPAAPMVAAAECSSCHQQLGVEIPEARCAACHGADARAAAPPDHAQAWLVRHGTESRWRVFGDHGRDCQLCHARDACVGCHRERRPTSHTGLWRVRMHGSAAAWDREGCKTCHETGTCVRCHRSSAPVSHRGDWSRQHGRVAGGFDSNCTICHRRAWCIACHSGARR